MRNKIFLLSVFFVILFAGCKQKEWTEWKVQNEVWLQDNATKDGVITTPSGLQYKILYEGNPTAAKPSTMSTVYISYSFRLINGVEIESQANSSLYLPTTVSGFAEGMTKIHKTGDIELYIPWELGYTADGRGTEGYSAFIPPYSTLIYRIHLIDLSN